MLLAALLLALAASSAPADEAWQDLHEAVATGWNSPARASAA